MVRAIVIDQFAFKQFEMGKSFSYIPYDLALFEEEINQLYHPDNLKPGYAPFCKHLFMPNFTQAKVGTVSITNENQHLLRSAYEARTEKELPVLTRWIPLESIENVPVAQYLDIILYSFAQIQIENAAMGNTDRNSNYEWGVVSVKPQDIDHELPMTPITMLRNALGVEYGGSGAQLDKGTYMSSVEFWQNNALIR